MLETKTKTNFNHSTNNGNKQNNGNNNNQNKLKKLDYKLYFYISLGISFIIILYFLTSKTPENLVKQAYEDNQKTYKVVQNLKAILDGKEVKEEIKK